jgi:hypothetical protein
MFVSTPIILCRCGWDFGLATKPARATEAEQTFAISTSNVFERTKEALSTSRLIGLFACISTIEQPVCSLAESGRPFA